MSPNVALGITGIAFMAVATLGAYINYRWIKRITELKDFHHGND